jgi:hypothetical protein
MPALKFQTGWSYWLFGDKSNNIAPFQYLKATEFSSKTCRSNFRSYRKVMLRVQKEIIKKTGLAKDLFKVISKEQTLLQILKMSKMLMSTLTWFPM